MRDNPFEIGNSAQTVVSLRRFAVDGLFPPPDRDSGSINFATAINHLFHLLRHDQPRLAAD